MDDDDAPPAAEKAYENTADEIWEREAVALHRDRRLQVQAFATDGVVSAQVWGTCPRCGHDLNVQQTLSVPIAGLREGRGLWQALTRQRASEAAGIPDAVEVGCGCGRAHPGAPDAVTGCGVSFRLPTAPPDCPRSS